MKKHGLCRGRPHIAPIIWFFFSFTEHLDASCFNPAAKVIMIFVPNALKPLYSQVKPENLSVVFLRHVLIKSTEPKHNLLLCRKILYGLLSVSVVTL